ncbi:MAG: HAD family hydrolase [Candidatus Bathyarchaeota archaeon]|jgi:HAD superfamily hydrolase (TIGR01509 family)
MRIEGVLFDLDATLINLGGYVDWKEAHKLAYETYISCGCSAQVVSRCGRQGLFNMLNLVREENSLRMNEEEVDRIQGRAFKVVERCELVGLENCSLMPKCAQTLDRLKSSGLSIGVCTSNSQLVAEKALESHGIRHYFSSVVGRRSELRMKPYPDQLLKCLKEIGVDPMYGVMVGDSIKDVQAAKSIGLFSVSIPSYFTSRRILEENGTDAILEGLEELPHLINRVNKFR